MTTIRKYKTITISAHARDCFGMTVVDKNGKTYDYDGYVPHVINGGYETEGTSDDLHYIIDIETGQILNWNTPTDAVIENFIALNKMDNT